MAGQMWFGNAEKMRWVPCPAIDMGASKSHWTARSDYLNGGIGLRRSSTGAMVYQMNWNLTSEAELDKIEGYYEGVWGEGPFYFLDPQAMNTNVFPAAWAQPRVALVGGPPLVFDQKPIKVVTSSLLADAPTVGVQYTLNSESVPEELTIPIPDGYKFIFSVFQDDTTSAYLAFTQDGAAPVKAGVHTLHAATGGSLVKFALTGTGTARVYAMMGQILPISVYTPGPTIPVTYDWTGAANASTSTETVDGVLTRTNLIPRPVPTASGGWYSNNAARNPVVTDTAVLTPAGNPTKRADRAATSPNPTVLTMYAVGSYSTTVASNAQVVPGRQYTYSLWVLAGGPDRRGYLTLPWMDAAGTVISTVTATSVPLDTGWQRLTVSGVAPANAVATRLGVYIGLVSGVTIGGEQAWVGDAQLEEGSVATPFFYGDTADTPYADPKFFDSFISGKGNSGVDFEMFTRNVYSAAIDKVGASATMVEVGSWR